MSMAQFLQVRLILLVKTYCKGLLHTDQQSQGELDDSV